MGEEKTSPSSFSVHSSSRDGKKPGGWKSIKYILGNESFEKLASMSLIANIVVYMSTKYNLSGIFVVTVVNVWSGFSNVSSLAGAFVSDAYLGKFKTLLFGSIFSLLGMATMTLTAAIPALRPWSCNDQSAACSEPEKWQLAFLFVGLGLLSIGAGGIRPCNIAFGADQFDTRTEKGKAQLESFFNWWYFTFTIALVIALTGVVYIQTNVSWPIGFAIPTACLILSITIFLIGSHTYIKIKPQGSIFSDILKVIIAACRKHSVSIGPGNQDYSIYDSPVEEFEFKLSHTDRFRFLDKAAILTSPDELNNQGKPKNNWKLCSLQQVEQFKCIVAVLPVGISGIGAFLAMDQTNTFGVLQAIQMKRKIGSNFLFPPGWLNISSMISLSIWIYTYERIYLPIARKRSGKEKRLTMKQRIQIGIVMSILAMIVGGIVERHRRYSALKEDSFVSPASVALLFPQFCFSGLTEAFAAVAIMEFFTMQLTENMRTVAGAMFFLCLSISSYIGSLLVNIIHKITEKTGHYPWLGSRDLNHNRLDYYYFILAAFAFLNLIYFSFFASHYLLSSTRESEKTEAKPDELVVCNSKNLCRTLPVDEENAGLNGA
ncbi:hypothetical protein UlMin_008130 [Ulmus minor]